MNKNIDLTKILKNCPKGWKLYSSAFGEVEFQRIVLGSVYPIIIKPKTGLIEKITSNGKLLDLYDVECALFPSKEQRDWSKFTAPWYKKEESVKPKFKVGDKIVDVFMKYMDTPGSQFIISEITDDKYIFTDSSYISISSQNSWELVYDKKSKFDPKTLKPFDRVLVRENYPTENWYAAYFSHIEYDVSKYDVDAYEETPEFIICTTDTSGFWYCIPYNDDTKHLVGTTNEAPEYYRYWEN